jgi:hypothetical protein
VMNSQALPDRPVLTTASSWNWYDVEISLAVAYLALGWSRIILSLIGLSTCLSTADGWSCERLPVQGLSGHANVCFFFPITAEKLGEIATVLLAYLYDSNDARGTNTATNPHTKRC